MCKVAETRPSSARATVMADSVYLVLNSLWDWEPVERLKLRSDTITLSFSLLKLATAILIYIYLYKAR